MSVSQPVTISDLLSQALSSSVNLSAELNITAEQFAKRHGIDREQLEALGSIIALALGVISAGNYADPGSMLESEALNKIHRGLEAHMGERYDIKSAHVMSQVLVASWLTQLSAMAKFNIEVLEKSLQRKGDKGFG